MAIDKIEKQKFTSSTTPSHGYEQLLEVIQDPSDEEYESTSEWLGGDFDPNRWAV